MSETDWFLPLTRIRSLLHDRVGSAALCHIVYCFMMRNSVFPGRILDGLAGFLLGMPSMWNHVCCSTTFWLRKDGFTSRHDSLASQTWVFRQSRWWVQMGGVCKKMRHIVTPDISCTTSDVCYFPHSLTESWFNWWTFRAFSIHWSVIMHIMMSPYQWTSTCLCIYEFTASVIQGCLVRKHLLLLCISIFFVEAFPQVLACINRGVSVFLFAISMIKFWDLIEWS